MDIREQFAKLDLWPISALDKRKEVVTVSPCGDTDLETLTRMYDTYEPKAAIQGLPPVDQNTRVEWIRSCLRTAMNLKAELGGAVVAHGMLFPMPDPAVVEFNLFVHNRTQNRGLGLIVGLLVSVVVSGIVALATGGVAQHGLGLVDLFQALFGIVAHLSVGLLQPVGVVQLH